jgi:hypothetical protein
MSLLSAPDFAECYAAFLVAAHADFDRAAIDLFL